MDSGNSGSMQSSSGGDEEYDSRAETFSAFLDPSGNVGSMSNPQQTPLSHHQTHPSSLFDPLSNFLDPFSRSPPPPNANSMLNLDAVWSRGLRSEPNCTEIGGLMGSSSSNQTIGRLGRNPFSTSSSMPLPPGPENGARPSASTDQTNVVRNSKKRSRASRRAPTTVLTTDTSNFRAMVQEFTGIPAPPFSASPFPRSRLDLFSTASSMRTAHLDPAPPPYLLRPFAHKVQPPSFGPSSTFSSSTLVDAIASTTTTNTNSLSTAAVSNTSDSTSTINYQLSSDLGLHKQPQNLLGMQNQILTFQSLLQSPPPPKYPLANVSMFGTKSSQGSLTIPLTDSQLKMGVLDEYGLNHGAVNTHLSGLPSLVPPDEASLRNDNNPTSWADGVGSNDGDHQLHLKSFSGNYGNSQRANGCRMNNSGSSSDFRAEKGSDNVSSRGEGMVDSWICSSD